MSSLLPSTKFGGRRAFVLGVFLLMGLALWARAFQLQILDAKFYQQQGDVRHIRTLPLAAHRGMLLDRNGEPLAVSSPIKSVWADPRELIEHDDKIDLLGYALEMDPGRLRELVRKGVENKREFIYLRRHVHPRIDKALQYLKQRVQIAGVNIQREYGRYYPSGEITAHVLGFNNIDDQGQEGLELAFDEWLEGTPGKRRVVTDVLGDAIEDIELVADAQPGRDLVLSIDKRIQYLAYRELKQAVQRNGAKSGSAVVLDSRTGEVLAMVNQPSYNPNRFSERVGGIKRNRAVTDVLEPGSTIKPFTVAAALESGVFGADDVINTSPGRFNVGRYVVRDYRNYGDLSLTGILKNSSNVGASKISLQLEKDQLWRTFDRLGFGQSPLVEFPGAVSGSFPHYSKWSVVRQATVAYGYGVSTTALQLARAYTALASDGLMPEVTFQKLNGEPRLERVFSAEIARQVRTMMRSVVSGGTGKAASIPGYTVSGKTGTTHISENGSYADDRYLSQFAGMAPAEHPAMVAVVVIKEPQGRYYGGEVAAPVFSRIMAGALRIRNVNPDGKQVYGVHAMSVVNDR
ncbi:cell division protein [Chromatiales bacterium (ex Bugula neritina AB1)]|nr:cell division protein [Chromatiales bacterium (ex Bugula neritina AB1)]